MPLRIKKIKSTPKETQSFFAGLAEVNPNYNEHGSGVMPNAQRHIIDEGPNEILDYLNYSLDFLDKSEAEDLSLVIKKIAQTIDYEERLKSAINKIYESDHFDKVKNIKKLTEAYFLKRNSMIESGESKESSESAAFNYAINELSEEFSSFYKKAQFAENSPTYVADQLASVIKIMLQRIKPESRLKSLNSIRDKIKDFNIPEIANKKSPGGAAIGVTLSLVKNMLMARDEFFIDAVLRELILRL